MKESVWLTPSGLQMLSILLDRGSIDIVPGKYIILYTFDFVLIPFHIKEYFLKTFN